MKAMLLTKPTSVFDNPLVEAELTQPKPNFDEVLINIKACGVCHTDLHTVEGDLKLPKLPIVPGHQIVGIIEEIGKNVKNHKIGDRVGVTWLNSACGICDFCKRDLENLCEDAKFTGLNVNGGYAEYTVVPAKFVFKIHDKFSLGQAAPLLCAGVIGYRSLRLSEIQPGQSLGLYGFGASAHITIQVANHLGCEVFVFTRSEEHRKHAMDLGAVWAGSAKDIPPKKMDSSITFAPVGWIIPEALRVLNKGGTLAINAVHMSPLPEIKYDLIYHEKTVRSVANLTRNDAIEFLKLAGDIPIITEVEMYNLNEANIVLQKIKRAEINGAAVLKIND